MMWNWRMLAAIRRRQVHRCDRARALQRHQLRHVARWQDRTAIATRWRSILRQLSDPTTRRQIRNPWYDTTCCPPNLERTFASLPGYFYSTSDDGVYVHLYDNSEMNWHLQDGNAAEDRAEDALSLGGHGRN